MVVDMSIEVKGTKELRGKLLRLVNLIDKQFKPALTKSLAEEGVKAIRKRLHPHRFRGNILLAGVFSKSTPGGSSKLVIKGDATWFEEGVKKHPVSLLKVENEPLIQWTKEKGLYKTKKGKTRGLIWVRTPRLNLSGIAENQIRLRLPSIGRKEWNRITSQI